MILLQFLLFLSFFLVDQVLAHVTLWDPAMYGFDGTTPGGIEWNGGAVCNPLRKIDNLSTKDWFGHGVLGFPPASAVMNLPAGGYYNGQLSCNRAFTTYRNPGETIPFTEYACATVGPTHTVLNFGEAIGANASRLFGGTTLSIAYQPDINKLKPSDFAVISVIHESVWFREVAYEIPAGLPACPDGGCHCAWNWIHTAGQYNADGRGEGYGEEMYMTLYKCKVTGSTSNKKIGPAQVSRLCENDPSSCVKGPKQPHYWSQADGNNNFDPKPPTHNLRYGFNAGAQNDIFDAPTTPTAPTAASSSSSASSPPSAAWTNLGCVQDTIATNRVLTGSFEDSNSQTVDGCKTRCQSQGFSYAGMQYGRECFCGNSLSSGTGASAPSADCNMPCSGKASEMCGAAYRMSLYGLGAVVKPPPASVPSPTSSSSSTRLSTSTSSSISKVSTSTTSSRAISTSTSISVSSRTPFSSAAVVPSPVSAGKWLSQGCVSDSSRTRVLRGFYEGSNSQTVDKCQALCRTKGFVYAGLQYGRECYCGGNLDRTAAGATMPAADCNAVCFGDRTQICGGTYRMSLYKFAP